MKLKEVTHTETWGDKEYTDSFSFSNNRFLLFDKNGNELNEWTMKNIEDVLEFNVLETRKSCYEGWGVGFPTTHIKLDFVGNSHTLTNSNFKYKDNVDTRM